MDDLFDTLKTTASPLKVNSSPKKNSSTKLNSPVKSTNNNNKYVKTVEDFNEKIETKGKNIRRESLPSPTFAGSSITKKSKSQKARSLSPPKHLSNVNMKSLKVKLERRKIEEFLNRPLEEHANNIRSKQDKTKDVKQGKKSTPTKAQQKLFEPMKNKKTKAQILKEFNIKPCKVRIHRDNLEQLSKEFRNKGGSKAKNIKRSAASPFIGSPPVKKAKSSPIDSKSLKSKNSFFIKLNPSPSSKLDKKLKNITRFSSSLSSSSSSSVAHHNKIRNSKSSTSVTTPTKFSRSQLIGSFGKRFFNVQVKIERCTHPLMLTFESNDRARRLQAKRNKSKNLSVSFREQVEIFGGSSESDDSYDEDFCAVPNRNNRKNSNNQSVPATATPVVMPARLKKVENGKVVDDIELDPSLFVDPKILVASTPFSPGRKKRDHKSFSPLKDESSPSPRKEQLKLANERVPPSGLRRLNIDEEDDEDDDCEYIVPIELPQRRTSRTSSNATLDDIISPPSPLAESTNFSTFFNNDENDCNPVGSINLNFGADKKEDKQINNVDFGKSSSPLNLNTESISSDSFQSAKDAITEKETERDAANSNDNHFPSLRVSPNPASNANGIETSKTNGSCNVPQSSEKEHNARANSKNINTLDAINTMEDISINLFLEDSQTNDDNQAKSIVDSLINETIDKLTKDIDESGAADKH